MSGSALTNRGTSTGPARRARRAPRGSRSAALVPFTALAALAASLGLASAPPALAQDADAPTESSQGSLPAARPPIAGSRGAEAELGRAEQLERTGRWEDAARIYVELIRAYLAPADGIERVVPAPQHAGVWRAAGLHARERLEAFPAAGQAAFRRAFDAEARVRFDTARAARDEIALVNLARLYPIASCAWEVHEALGDLALERGDTARAAVEVALAAARMKQAAPDLNPRRIEGKRDLIQGLAAEAALRRERQASLAPESWPQPFGAADRARAVPTLDGVSRSALTADLMPTYTSRMWSLRGTALPRARIRGPQSSARGLFPDVWPAIADGRVVVACDGSIACHDLRTGAALWRQRIWQSRDTANPHIPGAATIADGRVFASFVHKATRARAYHGTIPIAESIPTRRLVAFDLVTGKRLWDHAASSEAFLHDLSVALPPAERAGRLYAMGIVAGSSLKAYAICIDAATGALLWRRYLGDGQVELTMFGNHAVESLHGMVSERDGRIYGNTGVGANACLDALTGEIQWLRPYEPIPIQAARTYYAVEREIGWRLAPPIVAAGAVVVAPLDAHDLFALDQGTGALRWRAARTEDRRVLGLHRGRVIVQGVRLKAYDLATGKLVQVVPAGAVGRILDDEPGQGLICGDVALVPSGAGFRRYDLVRGEALAGFPFGADADESRGGSMVVAAGRVVSANPERLTVVGVEAGY